MKISKQVIVMRKALNMRKGKMIAQGAHASMKVILNLMDGGGDDKHNELNLRMLKGDAIDS
jgi:PTH2 family peptidyl-tRNA hydrolase